MSWKDYFYFTKTERNGITVLIALIIIIAVFPHIYALIFPAKSYQYDEFIEKVDHHDKLLVDYENAKRAFEAQKEKARNARHEPQLVQLTPFLFNPNELSHEEFTGMGLPERIARNIINYRNAGGSFRFREDLGRIYGLDDNMYGQLENYIDLPSRSETIARRAAEKKESKSSGANASNNFSPKEPVLIHINSADTTQWQKIRGIGPVFSRRITSYRDRLGGFYSLEQLREVFGMDSTRYDQIFEFLYLDSIQLQQININTADFVTLVKHPYLERHHVKSILQMRETHGNYQTIEDIKKSHLIDDVLFEKIQPYLKVTDQP